MKSKPRTLPIGTISHGTMRPEDLIPAFIAALDSLHLEAGQRATLRACRNEWRSALSLTRRKPGRWEGMYYDMIDNLMEELWIMMGDHCPCYCNFGSHEDDGSDYGVWIDHDAMEEDRRTGDLPETRYVVPGYSGPAVSVSDHGNITLYEYTRGRARVVWSIV